MSLGSNILRVPRKVPEIACEEAVMSIRRTTGGVVALLLLGLMVNPAWAQTVIPSTINFDVVTVGEVGVEPFTVYNYEYSVFKTIETIELTAGDTDVFSTNFGGAFPLPPLGAHITYNVTFEPPDVPGTVSYYAVLTITIDGQPYYIDLSGVGEGIAPQNPEAMIDALIADFNAWVSDGSLRAAGRGRFTWFRLFVMKFMLHHARRLIYFGHYNGAYRMLYFILRRADGVLRPWDYVAGPARQEFANRVSELMSVLGGY